MSQGDSPLPVTLRVAVGLLLVEAVGVLIVAGLVVDVLLSEYPGHLWGRQPVAIMAFGAVIAAALAGLGWQLLRRRAWARGPAVALELFFLPAGYYLTHSGVWALGIPVSAAALTCIVLLLAPASRAALGIR